MCAPNYKNIEEVKEIENLNEPLATIELEDITDNDTVILNEIDFTWEESFYFDMLKFEIGFLAAEDSRIIDLYAYHYPNEIYSVLRKGCDYQVYKKALGIEENFDAVGISIDPECYLHVYGLFYKGIDGEYSKFFCLRCAREEISNNREDLNVYSLHNYIDGNEIEIELTSMVTSYKYWCYGCDRFLFHIDYNNQYNDLNCISCLSVIPHDPKYLEDISSTEVIGQLPNNPNTIPDIDPSWPVQM